MAPASAILADPLDFASAGVTIGVTVAVIFVVVVGIGFGILFRRRRAEGADAGLGDLATRANILLVRVDDAVKNAEDELGYAEAQFGYDRVHEFAAVLTDAKATLIQAFALKQQLDDAFTDTETQRREWNRRIVSMCESIQSRLDEQSRSFDVRRRQERNAPADLAAVRAAVASTRGRLDATGEALTRLRRDYAPAVVAPVSDNVDSARALLDAAGAAADTAERDLAAQGTAADPIQAAQRDVQLAGQSLDGVDRLATSLAEARTRLASLVAATRDDLSQARAVRDSPPDPSIGAAVNSAIAGIESAVASVGDPAGSNDPAAGIRTLEEANATLDVALGSARNQAQRLEHARTALTGALLTARSQIQTTTDFITARRGRVGAEARTRLSEAERLLAIAEAEADPVIALDTARSSATHSRDADALARYDVMGG